ncbi:MFS transporter [Halonatronomonas betaini]|nr:MFS transporter [Halonatronomonas betaini]
MQPKQRDKILITMVIAIILSYLSWYNFSAVINFIIEDIELTPGQVGIIISAFQVGYVITVLLTGWLADRIGSREVVLYSTLGTAIFSTLFAWLAVDFWSALILRLLAGAFCGGIYAPGMSLLSNWFPSKERGKSIGAYIAGLTFSYAASYFIAPQIASQFSWRISILATSLPAFISVFIIYKFVKENPDSGLELKKSKINLERKEPGIQTEASPSPEGGFKGPAIITTSYMGHMWELYGFWGWIGPFMVSAAAAVGYEYSTASVIGGRLAAIIILIGAPAVWLMGKVSDIIGRTKTIIICSIASLIAQFFFGFLHGGSLIIITVIGLWIGFWVISDSACHSTGLTEMVQPEIRARSLGIQNALGFMVTAVSPTVFGYILEIYNEGINNITFASNWGLPFLTLGLGAILSPVAVFILRKVPQSDLMADGNK